MRRINDLLGPGIGIDVVHFGGLPASRLHELLPWEWKRLYQAEKPIDEQRPELRYAIMEPIAPTRVRQSGILERMGSLIETVALARE